MSRLGLVINLGIGTAYLANEIEGWSPLVKCSLFGYDSRVPPAEASRWSGCSRCSRCGRCGEVCPKGVCTEPGVPGYTVECVKCGACVIRCSENTLRLGSSDTND